MTGTLRINEQSTDGIEHNLHALVRK